MNHSQHVLLVHCRGDTSNSSKIILLPVPGPASLNDTQWLLMSLFYRSLVDPELSWLASAKHSSQHTPVHQQKPQQNKFHTLMHIYTVSETMISSSVLQTCHRNACMQHTCALNSCKPVNSTKGWNRFISSSVKMNRCVKVKRPVTHSIQEALELQIVEAKCSGPFAFPLHVQGVDGRYICKKDKV